MSEDKSGEYYAMFLIVNLVKTKLRKLIFKKSNLQFGTCKNF